MFKTSSILREFCFATIWEVYSRSSVQKHKNICYLKKEPTAIFCRCYKNHLVNYPTTALYLLLTTSRYTLWKLLNSVEIFHQWLRSFAWFYFTNFCNLLSCILMFILLTTLKMTAYMENWFFVKITSSFCHFIEKELISITVYISRVQHDGLIYIDYEVIPAAGSANIHLLIQRIKKKKLLFVKRTLRIYSVSFPMCMSDNSVNYSRRIHLLTESLYLLNTFFQLPLPSASGTHRNCCIIWQ